MLKGLALQMVTRETSSGGAGLKDPAEEGLGKRKTDSPVRPRDWGQPGVLGAQVEVSAPVSQARKS